MQLYVSSEVHVRLKDGPSAHNMSRMTFLEPATKKIEFLKDIAGAYYTVPPNISNE